MRHHLSFTLQIILGLIILPLSAAEYSIWGTTNKKIAIYQPGEKIIFTLKLLQDNTPVSGKKIVWTRTGDDGKKESGSAMSTKDGIHIETSLDRPGFVRIRAYAFDENGKKIQGYIGGWGKKKTGAIFFDGGACVQPEKLKAIEEPADFDEFWQSMKQKLAAVPIKAERKELPFKDPKIKLYAVSVTCAGPRPVTGYLSLPANAPQKSLRAIVQYHGYGVRNHKPPKWVPGNAIVFNINAHGMPLNMTEEAFRKFAATLKRYAFNNEENKDREKAYFYGMALRVMRSLQYVKSLPEWDGKNLDIQGGSQGGLQGLWAAGLDPDVTSADIWSPWCCDLGGITVGRMRGWRPDFTPALNYYDPVFHARRIKGKVKLVANLGDYTCPPSGVWIVYNNIPHNNKALEVRQGCTHGYQMKNHDRFLVTPENIRELPPGNKK